MATVQEYCLRWNNHQPNFVSMFTSLLHSESLVDVTVATEGKYLQAHKVVLSASSPFFQSLFTLNPCKHPIVILKDITYADLKVLVDYMYKGEVNVSEEQLPTILKAAETLKVKGLAESPQHSISLSNSISVSSDKSCDSTAVRRKRFRKSSTGSGSTEHTGTVTGGSEETVGSIEIPTMKTELVSEEENSLRHQPSTDSECTFHESVEEESHQSVEAIKIEENLEETVVLPSSSHHPTSPITVTKPSETGSKRGRLLVRQKRIKKESDDIITLTVPKGLERQTSEPGPTMSLPHINLLTVPKSGYLIKQQSSPQLPTSNQSMLQVHLVKTEPNPTVKEPSEVLRRALSSPLSILSPSLQDGTRSSHGPVQRSGPALGCNFCWNTFDDQQKIVRRKTKYHCPECQTNLCLVPCFQIYHERQGSVLADSSGTTVPTIVKTSSVD